MRKHATTAMLVLGTLAAMAAIGFGYENCIAPKHPTWHPQARRWDSLPLSVSWDREYWGKAHSESYEVAIDHWNSLAGFDVLEVAESPYVATIRILSANGEPCSQRVMLSQDNDGEAWLCPDMSAEIHIYSPGQVDCLARIAMHELGHVLGLDHSPVGIMRPKLGCQDRLIPADAQLDALKERYSEYR